MFSPFYATYITTKSSFFQVLQLVLHGCIISEPFTIMEKVYWR